MFSESAGGMGPPVMAMADKMSPSQSFSPATVVRKFFPENWLWGSYSVGQVSSLVYKLKQELLYHDIKAIDICYSMISQNDIELVYTDFMKYT